MHYSIHNIQQQSDRFDNCLRETYAELGIVNILDDWKSVCTVFIFSGFIRNFFVDELHNHAGSTKAKDLDIVVSDLDKCLQRINYPHTTNKYGGVKIHINDYELDVWQLDKTLGIVEQHYEATPNNLIKTSFFNYSAIAFNYNEKRFIVDDAFTEFMNSRTIDLVYGQNPHPELCIINTIHYAKRYNLDVSERLREWIVFYLKQPKTDLNKAQKEHFGYTEFSRQEISKFFNQTN